MTTPTSPTARFSVVPGPRTEPQAWYRRIRWSGAIWIVFLVFPLIRALVSPHPVALRLLTVAAILGFIVVDVIAISQDEDFRSQRPGAGLGEQMRSLMPHMPIMLVLALNYNSQLLFYL